MFQKISMSPDIKQNLITWAHYAQLITVSGNASYLTLMNPNWYVSVFDSRRKQIWFRKESFAVNKEKSTVSSTQSSLPDKEMFWGIHGGTIL